MKRVRITLDATGVAVPDAYELLVGGADYVSAAAIVNWNVATRPAGFLVRVEGDHERLAAVLADDPAVHEFEVLPVEAATAYCFLAGEAPAATRALFENFTRGSLLTVPPIRLNRDGTSTFTLVGPDADVQAAVERVPAGVSVQVEAVGGGRVADEGVRGRLTDRQREAVEAALAAGYYGVPREATTSDVAAELGCSPATAAAHLRKAEARLVTGLFRD